MTDEGLRALAAAGCGALLTRLHLECEWLLVLVSGCVRVAGLSTAWCLEIVSLCVDGFLFLVVFTHPASQM